MVPEEGGKSEGGFYKKARSIRLLQRQRWDWLSLRYTAVLQQWRRAVSRRAASSRGYIRASRVRLWADAPDAAGRVREWGKETSRCFEIRRARAFGRETRARPRCIVKVTSWLRSESARYVKRACVINRAISTLGSSRIIYEGCNGAVFNLSRDYNFDRNLLKTLDYNQSPLRVFLTQKFPRSRDLRFKDSLKMLKRVKCLIKSVFFSVVN